MPVTVSDGHPCDPGLLAEFTTLHTSAAQQLAMLLLRHALAALLDNRTHVGILTFLIAFLRTPVTYA